MRVFVHITCDKNILIITGKKNKNSIHNIGTLSIFLALFYEIS